MAAEPVITVEGLWKRYGMPAGMQLLRRVTGRMRQRDEPGNGNGPWALRGINIEVKQGETVGLIGRNGAGKSTLLKVLAGVSPPTWGRVEIRQRLFPMIELNAGIHFDLTGRENVYLLGAFMGLDRAVMNSKFKDIEEFCELAEWMDRPVRMYSSGMMARLGFGVAMNVDAEILLIDEVLAVGDMMFQRKCYRRLDEMRGKGVTTVFVSHSIRQVERLCERAYLLKGGAVALDGPAEDAAHAYYEMIDEERVRTSGDPKALKSPSGGTGEIYPTKVTVLTSKGEETDELGVFEDITVRIDYHAVNHVKAPAFAVGIMTVDMIQVILQTNEADRSRPDAEGPGSVTCRFVDVKVVPGSYHIKVSIKGEEGRPIYKEDGLTYFTIKAEEFDLIRETGGVVYSKTIWSY